MIAPKRLRSLQLSEPSLPALSVGTAILFERTAQTRVYLEAIA